MRSMKLLKDWLLMLVSVSFMASAKSARSARCCQRSLSDFSSCVREQPPEHQRLVRARHRSGLLTLPARSAGQSLPLAVKAYFSTKEPAPSLAPTGHHDRLGSGGGETNPTQPSCLLCVCLLGSHVSSPCLNLVLKLGTVVLVLIPQLGYKP